MSPFLIQLRAFAFTVLGGIFTALLYDFYFAYMRFRKKRMNSYIGDLIFWVVSTVMVFVILLRGNWGEVRLYVFMGWALGIFVYRKTVHAKMVKLLLWLFKLIAKIYKTMVRAVKRVISILTTLIKKIICLIQRIVMILLLPVLFLGRISRGIFMRVKLPLKYLIKEMKIKRKK